MSPLRLTICVLLCIALILNGSGLAVAATQMQVQHAGMKSAQVDEAPSTMTAHAACADSSRIASHADTPQATDHPSGKSCCEGSACDIACPTGLLVTLTTPAQQAWRVLPHVLAVRPALAEPPAPLLNNLYRPPIG